MSVIENSVWKRSGSHGSVQHEMGYRTYMFMVCLWTCVGISVSAVAAFYAQAINLEAFSGWQVIAFFVVTLVVALGGTFIATLSDNPAISMIGYALVTIAFGILLGPVVVQYTTTSVVTIFALTTLIVAVLGTVGALIPQDLASWGRPLLAGLVMLIIALVGTSFLGAMGLPVAGLMSALDWIGLFLFAALVVFDLNRASRLVRTQDNAIDSAMAIYLDFINIFIRLLSIMGQKK